MNHRRIYDALMARAQKRAIDGYCERHHIVPRALGGSNAKTNIVALTYREHFLAHWLLTKFAEGAARRKMMHALHMMGGTFTGRIVAGWQYEVSRRAQRDAKLGTKASEATKLKMAAALKGNKNGLGARLTQDQRDARSARLRGNKHSAGYRHSEATRLKRGSATKAVWSGYTEHEKAARTAKVSAGFARRRAAQGPRPWSVLGMSKRTWYRRGQPLPTAVGG
jgi:hypothetical protein